MRLSRPPGRKSRWELTLFFLCHYPGPVNETFWGSSIRCMMANIIMSALPEAIKENNHGLLAYQ